MALVSKREQDQAEALRRQVNGTAGLVQCDGCPAGTLVVPARPGHLENCTECDRHCICFVDSWHREPDF